MRFCAMAFSMVALTCSWFTTSWNVWGRYFRAITWYMGRAAARPRVIRGTRAAPLPLLPSGPGGVCGRPLHGARDLTSIYRNMRRFSHVCEQNLHIALGRLIIQHASPQRELPPHHGVRKITAAAALQLHQDPLVELVEVALIPARHAAETEDRQFHRSQH